MDELHGMRRYVNQAIIFLKSKVKDNPVYSMYHMIPLVYLFTYMGKCVCWNADKHFLESQEI